MKVNMQAVNFEANEWLLEYTEEKFRKLSQFYDQILSINVSFKLDNNNSKENKVLDVRVEVPGDDIQVSKTGQAYEECVDLAYDTLRRQIIKKKEKQ
ncbi:MAG: ribosome-associated translation inhibitor RaiA [Weeksellaceae bacterium]|nr:ribosome-associated translation inhibitor RaiA [Weeksellaceae bacterium]